jgi:hypothetical protein
MAVRAATRRGLTGPGPGMRGPAAGCVRSPSVAPGKADPVGGRKPGMSEGHRVLPAQCRHDGPPADVATWRRCRLLEAGFPAALAERLAAGHIDLHALLQLVDRGCPPELAAHMLAPLGPAGEELGP